MSIDSLSGASHFLLHIGANGQIKFHTTGYVIKLLDNLIMKLVLVFHLLVLIYRIIIDGVLYPNLLTNPSKMVVVPSL